MDLLEVTPPADLQVSCIYTCMHSCAYTHTCTHNVSRTQNPHVVHTCTHQHRHCCWQIASPPFPCFLSAAQPPCRSLKVCQSWSQIWAATSVYTRQEATPSWLYGCPFLPGQDLSTPWSGHSSPLVHSCQPHTLSKSNRPLSPLYLCTHPSETQDWIATKSTQILAQAFGKQPSRFYMLFPLASLPRDSGMCPRGIKLMVSWHLIWAAHIQYSRS